MKTYTISVMEFFLVYFLSLLGWLMYIYLIVHAIFVLNGVAPTSLHILLQDPNVKNEKLDVIIFNKVSGYFSPIFQTGRKIAWKKKKKKTWQKLTLWKKLNNKEILKINNNTVNV